MTALKDLPIQLNDTDIGAFCDRWKILELSLFGSVLREDFRADSDIDLLVAFLPNDVRWDCATISP